MKLKNNIINNISLFLRELFFNKLKNNAIYGIKGTELIKRK